LEHPFVLGTKEQMVAMIAHDLRQPLACIQGNLELATEGKDPKEIDFALAMNIREQAEYSIDLCDQLLNVVRLEAGIYELDCYPQLVQVTVAQAISTCAFRAERKRIKLVVEGDNANLETDHFLLRRVLANLIGNAAKFSPVGSTVFINSCVGYDATRISVKDEGPGIPAEDLSRIFDLFFRSEVHPKKRGSGIGLTFCRLAVQALNGRILVDSLEGKYSCFSIEIPNNPVEPQRPSTGAVNEEAQR
jgi:signal transduction histidine kinase